MRDAFADPAFRTEAPRLAARAPELLRTRHHLEPPFSAPHPQLIRHQIRKGATSNTPSCDRARLWEPVLAWD